MEPALSASERQELREAVGASFRAITAEVAAIDDPAELELAAAMLLPPEVVAEGPPGALEELIAVIGDARGGRRVLRAMAAAAPPIVARLALEAAGPLGDAADAFGQLELDRAWELDADEDVISFLIACRRPGLDGLQLFAFTVEQERTGALKDGFATPMIAEQEIEEIAVAQTRAFGIEPELVTPPELAVGQIAAAAQRCVELGLGPPPEAFPALALLLRAAAVPDAEELLAGLVGLPLLVKELEESDEDHVRAEIDALALECRGWCAGRGLSEDAVGRTEYVGGVMADYRAWYADGRLTAWDAPSLADFLLEWVPRKVTLDEKDVPHVPEAVAEVLRFLGGSGRLPSGRAESLARRALALGPDFEQAARDSSRFGLAKGMAAAMAADGVELTDPEAVQSWIDGFNSRTVEEREAMVPAVANLPRPQASAPRRRKPAKARKAQKQARRRNRGR